MALGNQLAIVAICLVLFVSTVRTDKSSSDDSTPVVSTREDGSSISNAEAERLAKLERRRLAAEEQAAKEAAWREEKEKIEEKRRMLREEEEEKNRKAQEELERWKAEKEARGKRAADMQQAKQKAMAEQQRLRAEQDALAKEKLLAQQKSEQEALARHSAEASQTSKAEESTASRAGESDQRSAPKEAPAGPSQAAQAPEPKREEEISQPHGQDCPTPTPVTDPAELYQDGFEALVSPEASPGAGIGAIREAAAAGSADATFLIAFLKLWGYLPADEPSELPPDRAACQEGLAALAHTVGLSRTPVVSRGADSFAHGGDYLTHSTNPSDQENPNAGLTLKKSATVHAPSFLALAARFEHGLDIAGGPQPEIAAKIYRRVADKFVPGFKRVPPKAYVRTRLYQPTSVVHKQKEQDDKTHFEHLAENGATREERARGKFVLGSWNLQGARSMEVNVTRACELFEQAYNEGSIDGGSMYAQCLKSGMGGTLENATRALEIYEEIAAKGHASSSVMLGQMYLYGRGVEKNVTKAEAFFRLAPGVAHAEYNLGMLHYGGWINNTDRNMTAALEHFLRAAARSHVVAHYYAGSLLQDGSGNSPTTKVPVDLAQASFHLRVLSHASPVAELNPAYDAWAKGSLRESRFLYEMKSEIGLEVASSNAAYLIEQGVGPLKSLENHAEAWDWRAAADAPGCVECAHSVADVASSSCDASEEKRGLDRTTCGEASCWDSSARGARGDTWRWLELQRRAAMHGGHDAMLRLGDFNFRGSVRQGGPRAITPNPAAAVALYRHALKRSRTGEALFSLGYMHLLGSDPQPASDEDATNEESESNVAHFRKWFLMPPYVYGTINAPSSWDGPPSIAEARKCFQGAAKIEQSLGAQGVMHALDSALWLCELFGASAPIDWAIKFVPSVWSLIAS